MPEIDAATGLPEALLMEHERLARQLDEEAHVNDGLAPVDLDRFWADRARVLRFATAGSVNNGSRLTGLRLIMSTIQRHGRFD